MSMERLEPAEYLSFLSPYPEATQTLHRALRLRMRKILPPCNEFIYDATQAVTTGFGFTQKPLEHFIHLPVYTNYVNLGFNRGAALDDPEGRLQGNGARVRHIRLTSSEQLDDEYIRGLIDQAVAQAIRSDDPPENLIKIIVMKGPKRRPMAG